VRRAERCGAAARLADRRSHVGIRYGIDMPIASVNRTLGGELNEMRDTAFDGHPKRDDMKTMQEKICALCGEDCSQRPRTKDPRGTYYCQSCYERARARRSTGAGQPASTVANATGALDMLPMILEELPQAPTAPQRVFIPCPGCRKPFDESAAVCTHCGWDERRRRRRSTHSGAAKTVSRWKIPSSQEALPFWHPRAPFGLALIVGTGFVVFAGFAMLSPEITIAYLVTSFAFSLGLGIAILITAFRESIGTGVAFLLVPVVVGLLGGVLPIAGLLAWIAWIGIILLWAWKYQYIFWLLLMAAAVRVVITLLALITM